MDSTPSPQILRLLEEINSVRRAGKIEREGIADVNASSTEVSTLELEVSVL